MTTTLNGHIEIDDDGTVRVAGSRIKVIHLVMERTANGWSADELQQNFPHLTLAEVYAALTYYYDNKSECDAHIEASSRFADEMRTSTPPGPFVERMRREGRII